MELPRLIRVARGVEAADVVLRHARIVELLTQQIIEGDLAIAGERIAGLSTREGPRYEGTEIYDLDGRYLAPGLIDAHVHIESAMVGVPEFARAVVPHGTTTVVTDPHEMANVLGMSGIRYMLQAAKYNPLSVFVMASSCVPAGPFESSGAELSAYDLETLMQDKWVLGLAEVMNFPAVVAGDEDILAKLRAAGRRPIDGHAPGLRGLNLNAYAVAGVGSDHECTDPAEAREKLERGMTIMIREATGARNLAALLPLVSPQNARRFVFCTDDRNPLHLLEEGHIDSMVRQAIGLGLDPLLALQLASLNTAEYFGLRDRGAIAPGRLADLIVFDDLDSPQPDLVFRLGRLVARDGKVLPYERPVRLPPLRSSINVSPGTLHFRVPIGKGEVRVIEIVPDQIITRRSTAAALVVDGEAVADPARDLLKLAVIERHSGSGRIGVGFVHGFGLKLGALGGTVAHDAHNIIVVGTDDDSMRQVVDVILEMRGGLVAIAGREVATLPLPIAGLMSEESIEVVAAQLRRLLTTARRMGCPLTDPFMTLSFLALTVIPDLKITDRGLLDVTAGRLVPLFLD